VRDEEDVMTIKFAIRLALCAGCLFAIVITAGSVVRSQGSTNPPFDERFRPVEVSTGRVDVRGPFPLSSRQLARLAAYPGPKPNREEDDVEEEVGLDDEPPCLECMFSAEVDPEPPTLELRRTPPPTSAFTVDQSVSDPQIAAGRTYLVVTLARKIAFFSKDGTQLQPIISAGAFFQPLTDVINASIVEPAGSDPDIWGIDTYYDMRTLYDPYRHRFWISGSAINNKAAQSQDPLIKVMRRNFIVAAVSITEDPRDGWYLYWWQATWDNYACAPNCSAVVGADYPSIGISQDFFLQEIGAGENKAGKNYSHVVVIDANALASGSNCCGFHFWNFTMPDGCVQLRGDVLQPAIHHGNPWNADLYASTWVYPDPGQPNCPGGQTRTNADPDKYNVVIWAITGTAQTPKVYSRAVPVKAFAANIPLKPGYTKVSQMNAEQRPTAQTPTPNFLYLSNIGNILQKTSYRDGSLYVTWQDCVNWAQSSTCYTSVRLVRIDMINGFQVTIDRSFGLRNVYDDKPGDFVYYGVPSVEVNADGNMAIVYQRSGKTVFPEARFSVYLAHDVDVLPSRALQTGDAPVGYNAVPGAEGTAGNLDVSGVSVDPFDDTAIWMIHGFGTQSGLWGAYRLAVGKVFGRTYPDLIPDGTTMPASAKQKQTIALQATVRNQGDGPSTATTVQLDLVSTDPLTVPVPFCEAAVSPMVSKGFQAANCTGAIPDTLPPGNYHVRASVDPANTVLEYSDTNNVVVTAAVMLVKK